MLEIVYRNKCDILRLNHSFNSNKIKIALFCAVCLHTLLMLTVVTDHLLWLVFT
jgi:hypothetical protein